ncbi:hypothetical protein EZS27_023728 [termite gut metagenome]|uniref:Polysaccharide pyruvyl transferase domain-containing protein n=1 Tax=termite gut metagenome TaxID=433724 RepID=A0A5J4R126_9ZZZZ
MKIGIITYHRSHNYGAVLQAYALKTYIGALGHDVQIVDYWPGYHNNMYAMVDWSLFKNFRIRGCIRLLLKFPFIYFRKKRRRNLFIKFIDTYLLSSSIGQTNELYDIVVYGSDQIWRCQNTLAFKGYNEIYFGNEKIKAKKKITYSASMGIINSKDYDIKFLSKVLNNFKAISVRERDLVDFIQPLTSLVVVHTLDPVFLLSIAEWQKMSSPRQYAKPYILLYNLQGNEKTSHIAQRLKQSLRIPIISIIGPIPFLNKPNEESVVGPKEFISWISYAEYVITSSFHGVAFSILMEKQFYVFQEVNLSRVKSLLSMAGIENRFITDISTVVKLESIDYLLVREKINIAKLFSMEYLKKELEIE